LTISDIGKEVQAGLTLTGTWNSSAETDHQSSFGNSAQIINSSQITQGWAIPATTTQPLTKLDYYSQPFWSDVIIIVVNPQFAIWDYPGGPLIQPLGNADVVPVPLSQLISCAGSPSAMRTLQPNSSNQSHFLIYASAGQTQYLWLDSNDCSNIASLDRLYVSQTQSSTPIAYRVLYAGSAYTAVPQTVSSSQTTQLVSGQSNGTQYTTKVIASQATTVDASTAASEKLESVLLTETGKGSWGSGTTQVHNTVVSYTAQNSTNQQSQTQASTTIQDSSGTSVPVNIVQDSIFQGIAVQDTAMHYYKHSLPNRHACCLKLAPEYAELPRVAWSDASASGRKERAYVLDSPFGTIIVQNPRRAESGSLTEKLRSDAAYRHFARRVPPPPPPSIVSNPKEMLEIIKSVKKPSPEMLKLMKELQTRVEH